MLADIPEIRGVDFSHLQLADTNPGSAQPVRKHSYLFLWFALALSLLLHLSLLLFEFGSKQFHQQQIVSQTLRINLQRTPTTPNSIPNLGVDEVVQAVPAPRATKEMAAIPVVKETVAAKEQKSNEPPIARLVIEPLSAQELVEITNAHSSTTTGRGTAAIAENVFHPGFRAQLSTEANKPKLARVEDSVLQTYTDPAGATVVKSPGGGCMRSPAESKIGAPKNWYFVACGGQSESEKMMERINSELKTKLQFK